MFSRIKKTDLVKQLSNLRADDSSRGMTLIEITVAVAIFLVAMLAIMQMFVTSIKLQRAFLAKTQTTSEASYLMEFVTRALRMAQKDTSNICGNGVNANFGQPDGPSSIGFMTFDGKCQEFYLSAGALKAKKWDRDGTVEFDSKLTSPQLTVEKFNIAAAGWDQNDYVQPRVAISLQIKDKVGSDFILQTTVSQRNPDIQR